MIQSNTISPDDWNKIELGLNVREVRVLYKYLEHEHIPYENYELLEVVRKISRFAALYEKQ